MDQQIITSVCGALFLAILAVSYIRNKRKEREDDNPSVTVKRTMDEVEDYLGLRPTDRKNGFAHTLDLMPMNMAASLLTSGKHRKSVENGARKGK